MRFSISAKNKGRLSFGFTFIEVTVATAIGATLVGIVIINLLNIHQTKTVQSASEILISSLRSQQAKAMSLSAQNTDVPDEYGIYFAGNSYFLFKGSSYDSNDTSNSEVQLPENFSFTSVTFPGNQVVFSKGSGEVQNYNSDQDSVTISDINNNVKSIEVNIYGIANYN